MKNRYLWHCYGGHIKIMSKYLLRRPYENVRINWKILEKLANNPRKVEANIDSLTFDKSTVWLYACIENKTVVAELFLLDIFADCSRIVPFVRIISYEHHDSDKISVVLYFLSLFCSAVLEMLMYRTCFWFETH